MKVHTGMRCLIRRPGVDTTSCGALECRGGCTLTQDCASSMTRNPRGTASEDAETLLRCTLPLAAQMCLNLLPSFCCMLLAAKHATGIAARPAQFIVPAKPRY